MRRDVVLQAILDMEEADRAWLSRSLERQGVQLTTIPPSEAILLARKNGGTDRLREMACATAAGAFEYSVVIDKGPHPSTRKAVVELDRAGSFVLGYAERHGVRGPDILSAVCRTPELAFTYAWKCRDRSEVLRSVASADPEYAYQYALEIDKGPHDVTREGACKDPHKAYLYALHVDGVRTPQTAEAAARDPGVLRRYDRSFPVVEGWDEEQRRVLESALDAYVAVALSLEGAEGGETCREPQKISDAKDLYDLLHKKLAPVALRVKDRCLDEE